MLRFVQMVGHSERTPIHVGLRSEVGITTVMEDEKSAGRMGGAIGVCQDESDTIISGALRR